jgi:DNA-binding response OmpR family regulator
MVRTVLVAASDVSTLEDATSSLLRLRYRCLMARTSAEALAALLACPVDLLVADAGLPGLASLLRRAEDDPRLRHPAILLLGAGDERHDHLATLDGPLTAERLGQTVIAIIGPPRLPTPVGSPAVPA